MVTATSPLRCVIVTFLVVKYLIRQEYKLQNNHETSVVVDLIVGACIASLNERSYVYNESDRHGYINLGNLFFIIMVMFVA